MKVISEPLTVKEMKRRSDANGYLVGVVAIDLSDAIDNDLEGWLDILSEKLTGSPLLMDISYGVVGHDGDELHVKVTGDISQVIECEEGD